MFWFGESWRAPCCVEDSKKPTPVGCDCGWCDEEIEDGDRGFIMPFVSDPGTLTCVLRGDTLETLPEGVYIAYHLECNLRQTLGSVGHIEGRCSCVGGDEEDPPGLTKREAAVAAVAAYERKHGASVT